MKITIRFLLALGLASFSTSYCPTKKPLNTIRSILGLNKNIPKAVVLAKLVSQPHMHKKPTIKRYLSDSSTSSK